MQLIDLVSVLLINEVKGVPTPKPKEYQAYAFPQNVCPFKERNDTCLQYPRMESQVIY